jgi:hypothetical protein
MMAYPAEKGSNVKINEGYNVFTIPRTSSYIHLLRPVLEVHLYSAPFIFLSGDGMLLRRS